MELSLETISRERLKEIVKESGYYDVPGDVITTTPGVRAISKIAHEVSIKYPKITNFITETVYPTRIFRYRAVKEGKKVFVETEVTVADPFNSGTLVVYFPSMYYPDGLLFMGILEGLSDDWYDEE